MFYRAICKNHKTVWIVIIYYVIFSLFSFVIIPDPTVTFVSEEHKSEAKYVLMFLMAPPKPVYNDTEGANIIAKRCGRCFITNNKGFLPITEYDAVLVFGQRNLLSEAEAATKPEKRYLIETTAKCIRDKLKRCLTEPKITSVATKESFTLCSLCKNLVQEKYQPKE